MSFSRRSSGSRPGNRSKGPLLGAVAIEQSILNILLFFIIAVAGFGILAIFSMIVVEKTRDIGIMKALGASTAGIRGIFLGYGLLLGAVGSGVGMAGGLLFVRYINECEKSVEQDHAAARSSMTRSITSTRFRRWSSRSPSAGSLPGPC